MLVGVSGHEPDNEPESYYVISAGAHDMPINGSRLLERQVFVRSVDIGWMDDEFVTHSCFSTGDGCGEFQRKLVHALFWG